MNALVRTMMMPLLMACMAASMATAAGLQPFPNFWPADAPLHRAGFDYWRVWMVRCDVRQTPTSPFNLTARQSTMTMWINELLRRKLPVDDVAPRQRVAKVTQLIAVRDIRAACEEIDAIFRGLEAMVAGKEYVAGAGRICGKVFYETGEPAPGVDVILFGTPLGAISDEHGAFTISNVPCASPRYIVQARKDGCIDGFVGGVDPRPDRPGEAALVIDKATPGNAYRAETLAVKVARLIDIKQTADPAVPIETAVADPEKYPEQVKPYLKPSASIDSDNQTVRAKAQQILASLSEQERAKSSAIAQAVYGWIVRNIEYDLMANYPDDPTGGNWQTTFGGWGRSFDDWCYKPSEVLEQKRAICVEYERLAAALLRALNVPARPAPLGAHPVCQWWVQLPAGNGYWANMETSRGRTEFKRTGSLDARFPAVGDHAIAFHGVDERAPIHVTWDAKNPCLWLEHYGRQTFLGHADRGLKAATKWLEMFAERGRLPKGAARTAIPPARRRAAVYELNSRGVVINLAGLRNQDSLTVRFPVFLTNQYRATVEMKHWTNHPEWVKATRREKEQNEFTGESLEWYCIDFEFGAPKPAAAEAKAKGEGEKPAETKTE